jgi:hypothetical protein
MENDKTKAEMAAGAAIIEARMAAFKSAQRALEAQLEAEKSKTVIVTPPKNVLDGGRPLASFNPPKRPK